MSDKIWREEFTTGREWIDNWTNRNLFTLEYLTTRIPNRRGSWSKSGYPTCPGWDLRAVNTLTGEIKYFDNRDVKEAPVPAIVKAKTVIEWDVDADGLAGVVENLSSMVGKTLTSWTVKRETDGTLTLVEEYE